ncbi:aldehyde dehydrogenase family protein [Phaeocystidibacter luteus]|uniref:Aldehyde dehydrogenase n=1 Tax=Phaeocystidibacter luteus TaxID=911197 RepID=A0A6N6RJ57_9FLAO|nr:aldehyde dehydrogenase family protein [Phaeocystidibacter luteus]KAB2814006.1 aldehyde dehydrogenase family protein [Phaeocystidibacter luteus]
MMNANELEEIKDLQTAFFQSNATRDYRFRLKYLKALKRGIQEMEEEIIAALKSDFSKPKWETWTSEIGLLYSEIDHFTKHLKRWVRPKSVPSPLPLFPSRSKIYSEPMGRCFIIAPWNYPFQLVFEPLIACLGAGNTALVKPSELTPATAKVVEKLITKIFPKEYVAVVQGEGEKVVPEVFDAYRPQHVFFTGSPAVGKIIAKRAAEDLVPCVLELGGKSPAIIDGTTPMRTTVRRIILAKFLNAGQTCVAPDYILIEKSAKENFLVVMSEELKKSYGENPMQSADLASIIHDRAFSRLTELMRDGDIAIGGKHDASNRRIEPTLLTNVSLDSRIMREEIFGPILPVIEYNSYEEIIDTVRRNPDPLSLYVFTKSKKLQKGIIRDLSFGGGSVNNAVVQFTSSEIPFGGVRNSGQGNYHGKFGFDAFSHQKAMVSSGMWFDPGFKYAPYTEWSLKVLRKLF